MLKNNEKLFLLTLSLVNFVIGMEVPDYQKLQQLPCCDTLLENDCGVIFWIDTDIRDYDDEHTIDKGYALYTFYKQNEDKGQNDLNHDLAMDVSLKDSNERVSFSSRRTFRELCTKVFSDKLLYLYANLIKTNNPRHFFDVLTKNESCTHYLSKTTNTDDEEALKIMRFVDPWVARFENERRMVIIFADKQRRCCINTSNPTCCSLIFTFKIENAFKNFCIQNSIISDNASLDDEMQQLVYCNSLLEKDLADTLLYLFAIYLKNAYPKAFLEKLKDNSPMCFGVNPNTDHVKYPEYSKAMKLLEPWLLKCKNKLREVIIFTDDQKTCALDMSLTNVTFTFKKPNAFSRFCRLHPTLYHPM